MRNVDALLAIHRTCYYLKLPTRHHTDLIVDTEAMIGRFSSNMTDKFGYVVSESGTSLINPNFHSHAFGINGTFMAWNYGGQDFYLFWWDGEKLREVTPEDMDNLLVDAYLEIMLEDQIAQTEEYLEWLTRMQEPYIISSGRIT